MKRIRYLTLLCMLLCGIIAKAQFNPSDPAEPGQLTSKLVLAVSPNGAGSASGGGDIVPGTSVTVNASAYTGWKFVKWTNGNDVEVSTNASYTFTKGTETEKLTAIFEFDPDAPSEPDELPCKLTLIAEDGGSASGGGYYLTGTTVNISAYAYTYYDFDGWFFDDGTCYSSDASTTYVMGEEPVTLTARFTFNPGSPEEPGEINGWRLKLKAQDGGSVNADKYLLKEGETTTVRAYVNSGYVFAGWYNGETLVSEDAVFVFTMGNCSVTLEARFEFSPDSPGEPDQIKQRKFSFMLKGFITKPEASLQFPILLTPLATLGDMTFQLNFDSRLSVDVENAVLAETSTPYTVTHEEMPTDEELGEGYKSYKFTLTGGSMVVAENETPTVTAILTFPISIPKDIETATSYKISINQISVTTEDGSTETAGTRNGRIYVYKNGDANGDDEVNVTDIVEIVDYIMEKPSDRFIAIAADLNDDVEINVTDIVKEVSIIMSADANAPMRVSSMEMVDNDQLTLDVNDRVYSLHLNNEAQYVASQFEIRLGEGQTLEGVLLNGNRSAGHQVTYAKTGSNLYKVIVFSTENRPFSGNSGELLSFKVSGNGSVEVSNILFVTYGETEKLFPSLSAGTTGIDVTKTSDAMDVYSIDGRMVRHQVTSTKGLGKGLYIINGKKTIVK